MKYKEIKECVKELGYCDKELYKRFCEGKFCTECKLAIENDECILNRLVSVINALEKILYGEKIKL